MTSLGFLVLTLPWVTMLPQLTSTSSQSSSDRRSTAVDNLKISLPSREQTLTYIEALKNSNFSNWKSLNEIAETAGRSSCSEALNSSILTSLYLLGLFNLCAASPLSCCLPDTDAQIPNGRQRRKRGVHIRTKFKLGKRNNISPKLSTSVDNKIKVNLSVIKQVRDMWNSNPRLSSNVACRSTKEAVRASFISLSGVTSGLILAHNYARVNQCYPKVFVSGPHSSTWSVDIPKDSSKSTESNFVPSIPSQIPVEGKDEVSDGCPRASVRLANGLCAAIFSTWPCNYKQWVLLNEQTGQGECFPKICPYGKIFLESDQLCHDVHETDLCPVGQRLFLTAWGQAVCDCDDGMFYGPDQRCHGVYERSYCYKGSVLQFHKSSKTLVCKTDLCRKVNNVMGPQQLPFVSFMGACYQFGTRGPCDSNQRLGFDIETLSPDCVTLEEAGLVRPQSSFQYSHMSFPGKTRGKGASHYEISYVILNGTSWELKVSTLGRRKRDTLPLKASPPTRGHPPPRNETNTAVQRCSECTTIPLSINSTQTPNQSKRKSTKEGGRKRTNQKRKNNSRGQKRRERKGRKRRKNRRKKGGRKSGSSDPSSGFRNQKLSNKKSYNSGNITLVKSKPATNTTNKHYPPQYPLDFDTQRSTTNVATEHLSERDDNNITTIGKSEEKLNMELRLSTKEVNQEGRHLKHENYKPSASSSSHSLLDFFRRRGHPKGWNVRRSKVVPGIINAPLLNQCRPGAKRDYNGHCRSKVVPSLRVPRSRQSSESSNVRFTTAPNIKCKKDERLDWRGNCRKTFANLG